MSDFYADDTGSEASDRECEEAGVVRMKSQERWNRHIREYRAKRKAAGLCQLCGDPAAVKAMAKQPLVVSTICGFDAGR